MKQLKITDVKITEANAENIVISVACKSETNGKVSKEEILGTIRNNKEQIANFIGFSNNTGEFLQILEIPLSKLSPDIEIVAQIEDETDEVRMDIGQLLNEYMPKTSINPLQQRNIEALKKRNIIIVIKEMEQSILVFKNKLNTNNVIKKTDLDLLLAKNKMVNELLLKIVDEDFLNKYMLEIMPNIDLELISFIEKNNQILKWKQKEIETGINQVEKRIIEFREKIKNGEMINQDDIINLTNKQKEIQDNLAMMSDKSFYEINQSKLLNTIMQLQPYLKIMKDNIKLNQRKEIFSQIKQKERLKEKTGI